MYVLIYVNIGYEAMRLWVLPMLEFQNSEEMTSKTPSMALGIPQRPTMDGFPIPSGRVRT